MTRASVAQVLERAPAADELELPLDHFDLPPDAVKTRFDWARRRGHPQWLWPEVTPQEWREALGAIATVARGVLAGDDVVLLQADPAALTVAAYTSGMGPLLGHWVEEGRVAAGPEVAALLSLHLRHSRLRCQRTTAEAVRAAGACAAAGITPTLLKGAHTAHVYFPEPATRPSSDVDLLVPPAQEGAAERVLRGAGYVKSLARYQPFGSIWVRAGASAVVPSLSLVHADEPGSLDLHPTLNRTFAGTAVVRFDDLWAQATPAPWPLSPAATVLPQPLLTLFLATHASQASLTLLRLVELVWVIRRDVASGALEWGELVRAAERVRALRFIHPALELTERLAPGTVPAEVLAACDAQATPATRRVLARLTLATMQPLDRLSLEERYMWAGSWWERARQAAFELGPAPAGYSWRHLLKIYRTRGWRLIRGAVGR
ncbi:MAG TPA: nucleotidyltransferase family protein [Longimicrobiaceae bacterium]|nr:nucleotidyltransferase family protein [Longimicrobiaceae bacterium]